MLAAVLVGQGVAQEKLREEQVIWTIRGRAIDKEGRPIAGACVLLGKPKKLITQDALDKPLAKSKEDGRFEVPWAPPKGPVWSAEQLLITAPGRASAVVSVWRAP